MLEYFAQPRTAARSLQEGDTSSHGDYELRYGTVDSGASRPQHIIEAHHPEDGRVGFLRWMGAAPFAIDELKVNEDHQRKGLATAMWNWAQDSARPKPRHSEQRTPKGDAWARSVGGRLPRKTSRAEGLFPSDLGNTLGSDITEYFGGGHDADAHSGRTAGRGRPRRDRDRQAPPQDGGGDPAPGGQQGQAGEGRAGLGGPRPVEFHPAAHKDLKALDKPEQRQIKGVIDALANGDPTLQTHALTQKLKGWYATKASRGHRVVHRPTDEGGIHVGYIGLHEYDKAIRRLTRRLDDLEPHQRALTEAQEAVRLHHPGLGMPLPTDVNERDDVLRQVLKEHGHPGHQDAFVHVHNGTRGSSNTAIDRHTGAVGVSLHPTKADYGTLLHETAHLLHDHATGRDFGQEAPDEHVHGIGYAQQYARLLGPWGSKTPGGNYRAGPGDLLLNTYYDVLSRKTAAGSCSCCAGTGEHGDIECHACDSSGTQDASEKGTRCQRRCPCGTIAEHDPLDGWQHTDGSVSHDGEHYGRSVSELMKQSAHDPHAHVRWGDGTYRSFRNAWGASHGNSYMIAGASAHLMGIGGYHHDDDEYMSGTSPERLALAHHALHVIHKSKGVDEPIYHGTKNPAAKTLKIGDEVRLPLTATTALADMAQSYGGDQDEDPGTVVHFPKGTPFYPQSEVGAADRKEYELDHRWDEAVTAGHFRVKHRYDEDSGLTHVHLEPVGRFNPHIRAWEMNDRNNEGRENIEPREAAHSRPTSRVFGPTFGLDHRLFTGESLKPEVRTAVMARLGPVIEPLLGQDWQRYTKVYLAGSEASEWTSQALEGNGDFDTLIGIDYDHARDIHLPLGDLDDSDITDLVNTALRTAYNASPWKAPFGGEWDLTGYVNANSYDITKIKPYAAYNITDDQWAVRPPHLPDWSIDKLPEGGQNLLDEAEGYAAVVEAISKMPEPFQTQQGKALWHHLHSDRGRAFSDQGEGWLDPGNLIEKALVEWGVWDKLVEWQYGKQKTAAKERFGYVKGRMDPNHLVRGIPAIIYHSDEDETDRDIEQNGIKHPLQVRHEQGTSMIMNGHHRHRKALQMGMDSVPVIVKYLNEDGPPPHVQDAQPTSFAEYDYGPGTSGHYQGWEKLHDKLMGKTSALDLDDPDHYRSYTDWDKAYERIPADVHRGMALQLPGEVHDLVHDHGRPEHERGQALLDEVTKEPLGMHWSAGGPEMAGRISHEEAEHLLPRERRRTTHVVLHADKPEREHIEDDIDRLVQGSVISWHAGNPEAEVPHKQGAPVNIWGLSWKHHDEPGWHYHELERPVRKTASRDLPTEEKTAVLKYFTAVKGSDHPLAPDLPPEQHDALTADSYSDHKRQTLELAKNPVPGTHIWRGELRQGDPVQSARKTGVGIHWGVNPDNLVHPHALDGESQVVYHAELEHPGEQNFSRDHPMWQGRHRSMDSEAEVRLKPGSKVKLHGVWVKDGYHPDPGHFVPRVPERMGKGWSYLPIGEHVPVAHRPSNDLIDYSDAGVKHEGMLGYFTGSGDDDYRMQHRPPDAKSGKPLHHYEGGDPDEHVRIYRSVPHDVDHIDANTWVTLNPDYAHQHGRDSHDLKKDWPVLSAEVPKRHVFWDENDENEHGYQGPRLESHEIEQHDEETGEHHPYEPPDEEEQKEMDRGGHHYRGLSLHLPPDDHSFVHDSSKPVAERAHRLWKHLPEKHRENRGGMWEEDADDAEIDAIPDDQQHRDEHGVPATQVVMHGSQNLDHAHGVSWADASAEPLFFSRHYTHHEFEGDPNQRLRKESSIIDYFGMAA